MRLLSDIGLLAFFVPNISVQVNGREYLIPCHKRLISEYLKLQPGFKTDLIRSMPEGFEPTHFVDVGANIGQTALEILSLLPNTKYYAFEPNPSCCNELEELCSLNNLNIDIDSRLCWNVKEEMEKLYLRSSLDASATAKSLIRPDRYTDKDSIAVSTCVLDDYFDFLPKEFLLKIDVEGSENEVLQGSKRLLSEKRPLILCEVLDAHNNLAMEYNNQRKEALEELLRASEYRIAQIIQGKEKHIFSLREISRFRRSCLFDSRERNCDYFFIPTASRWIEFLEISIFAGKSA